MKKYLLTFIALFLTSSAFAECALYVEDFEVKQDELGTEIVVPVKAHFSARLNAWQVDLTLPAGLRVTEAESGADQRVTYINSDGQEKKLRPDFSGPSEINRIIAIFMEKGYWQDPNGEDPNAWVPYGQIKWEGGDYNEMILLHLDVSPDFKGGNITFNTLASSTPDSRGGTIIENGDENTHFTRVCHVKVQNEEPIEPEDPHMTGRWIVLLDPEGLEYWYELITDPFDDANCYIMLSLRPDMFGEGDVPFYFMVNGTRYGAETDMQVPEFGDAEENVPNPLFESENMFCVPVLSETNNHIYYTYCFGLQFINDGINLLVTRGIMFGGSTGDPVFKGSIEDNTYIVEITPSEPGSEIYYRVLYPDETWSEWTEYTEALRFTDDGAYHIEAYALYYNKFPSDVIEYDFVISASNDVEETMGGKEIASRRYYNMLGQEMQEANGITIVVTTYTDGTTSAVKVLK